MGNNQWTRRMSPKGSCNLYRYRPWTNALSKTLNYLRYLQVHGRVSKNWFLLKVNHISGFISSLLISHLVDRYIYINKAGVFVNRSNGVKKRIWEILGIYEMFTSGFSKHGSFVSTRSKSPNIVLTWRRLAWLPHANDQRKRLRKLNLTSYVSSLITVLLSPEWTRCWIV